MATSPLKLFTHRCLGCRSPWISTERHPEDCLYCGHDVIRSRKLPDVQ